MKIKNKQITLNTKKRFEVIDITGEIEDFIENCSEGNGQVLIYSRHTTLAILINERESGIIKDAQDAFAKLFPQHNYYHHNDFDIRTENLLCDGECKNGDSHLNQLVLGTSETIPVIDSKLTLGQWQKVMIFELDGPRNKREIVFNYIGE